jgi:hypothetical protein
MKIHISAKCSDLFHAQLFADGKLVGEHDGYVPEWMWMPGQHWGDYVILQIDVATGQITNWKTPTEEELNKTFHME